MAIKPHPIPAPAFNVDNKFPEIPELASLSDEDSAALGNWYTDLINVLGRQFSLLTAEIDKKQDKP